MLKGLDRIRNRITGIIRKALPQAKELPSSSESDDSMHENLSDKAYETLQMLFSELGPRPAASPASRNAARRIASILEKDADETTLTSARIYPGLGKGMVISLIVALSLSSLFVIFRLPVLSIAVIAIYAMCFLSEMRKKGSFLRVFMSSNDASSVHAVIEPEEDVERTVVFSAHHDTAAIPRDSSSRKGIRVLRAVIPILTAVILLAISIAEIVHSVFGSYFMKPGIAPAVFLVFASISLLLSLSCIILCLSIGKEYSSGAGDNLSGVSAVASLASCFGAMKRKGKGLKHTRLCFVSFDGEECGTQGSCRWYENNSHILINPVNLNFDGLYDENELVLLTRDGNGFVDLSNALASRLSLIAASMGYKVRMGKLPLFGGETDAASAATHMVPSTTLTSMHPEASTPAHTKEDTPDKVSKEALSIAISLGIRLALDEDSVKEEKSVQTFLEDGRKYRLSR